MANITSIGGNPIVPATVQPDSITDDMLKQAGGVLADVQNINAKVGGFTLSADWVDGIGIWADTGYELTNAEYSYITYDVSDYVGYDAFVHTYLGWRANVCFYDKNGTFVSQLNPNNLGDTHYVELSGVVPFGAVTCKATCAKVHKDEFAIEPSAVTNSINRRLNSFGTDYSFTIDRSNASAGTHYKNVYRDWTEGELFKVTADISVTGSGDYNLSVAAYDANGFVKYMHVFSGNDTLNPSGSFYLYIDAAYRYINFTVTPTANITSISADVTISDGLVSLDATEGMTFTCLKGNAGDFNSLVTAVEVATRYKDSKVIVGAGEWNLIDEFGEDYFENFPANGAERGLYLSNGIHLVFSSKATVTANYTGENTNVNQWFAVFNSGEGGFTLENANIEASNIRYVMHDERGGSTDRYFNKYLGCRMYFDNTSNPAWLPRQCIGGGLGTDGYILIENCYFNSVSGTELVSYHNHSLANSKSRIDLHNCYFDGQNADFGFNWYGQSQLVSTAYVSGCSFGKAIVSRAETSDGTSPYQNVQVVEWNNTIRS